MSVLVEAWSLVITRKVLDVSFPGGTEAFLQWMNDPGAMCRCYAADENLVSACFLGAEDATAVAEHLMLSGVVAEDNGQSYELAFLDQIQGPTLPCDWLEWTKHEAGYMSCWLAGTEPGELHAPDGWTPDQSHRLSYHDIRNEPGRCLKLADEADGREVWLDFETGEIASSGPIRPDVPPTSEAPTSALMARVRSFLDSSGHHYAVLGPDSVSAVYSNQRGIYTVFFTANDATDFVGVACTYGSKIPQRRRLKIAEAATRVNLGMWLGTFEVDFESGELRCRAGIDVEDGQLSETMVRNMVGASLVAMEKYHRAFMRIAFAGVEPATALARVV